MKQKRISARALIAVLLCCTACGLPGKPAGTTTDSAIEPSASATEPTTSATTPSASAKRTETTAPAPTKQTTAAQVNAAALLERYYKDALSGDGTGYVLADLDQDGMTDLLVVRQEASAYGTAKAITLFYYGVENGKPALRDRYRIDGGSYGGTMIGGTDWYAEETEVYTNSKGFISLNYALCFDEWQDHYLIFAVENGKLTEKLHLYDPAYTTGVELCVFDAAEDGCGEVLYGMGMGGDPDYGKYDSYSSALDSEWKPFGFSSIRGNSGTWRSNDKGHVRKGAGIEKVFYAYWSDPNV